ncbi:hypothetical protein ACPA9J_30370 [Pseudomonas aeruginosa]
MPEDTLLCTTMVVTCRTCWKGICNMASRKRPLVTPRPRSTREDIGHRAWTPDLAGSYKLIAERSLYSCAAATTPSWSERCITLSNALLGAPARRRSNSQNEVGPL